MSKRYTLSECYELLQADPKTFRRWLKKAGLHEQVKNQISKSDDRVKYLTQEQLEELAALHERLLPTSTETEEVTPPSETTENPEPRHEGDNKKITIKPGTFKLIVDQLDELRQLQQQTTELATTTYTSLNTLETEYFAAQQLLQGEYQEKLTTLEQVVTTQQEQHTALVELLDSQLGQLEYYKNQVALQESKDEVQKNLLLSLEENIARCEHSLDHSVKTLRHELSLQKEQMQEAVSQLRNEFATELTTQQQAHQIEMHTLGEQVNGHIVTLMERLNATTTSTEIFAATWNEQSNLLTLLRSELQAEIAAREQLSRQVAALTATKNHNNATSSRQRSAHQNRAPQTNQATENKEETHENAEKPTEV